MAGWVKKLRGIAGLMAVGGIFGAVVGVLWTLAVGLLGLGTLSSSLFVWNGLLWGGFGAFSAGGFGLSLAALGRHSTLRELPAWKVGVAGALAGAAAPVGVALIMTGGVSVAGLGFISGMSGALGGLLGFGMVTVAKRSEREELEGGEDVQPELLDGPG